MSRIMEMAKDLGNAMARTDEYQALRRAIKDVEADEDLQGYQKTLQELEASIAPKLQAGEQPDPEDAQKYEETVGQLQTNMVYQRLVAAQTNFDKIVQKVNGTIAKGIEEGADSRIILAP